jgi:hypothetical protein
MAEEEAQDEVDASGEASQSAAYSTIGLPCSSRLRFYHRLYFPQDRRVASLRMRFVGILLRGLP